MSGSFRFASRSMCLVALCATSPLLAEPPFLVRLGALPGGTLPSAAIDVSADGSVVVGASRASGTPDYRWEAFTWTYTSGLTPLGDLPGGITSSTAIAVSDDGTTVVGEGNSAVGREPFRWTQSSGMVGLGGLPGQPVGGFATSVSGNGEIVVGQTRSGAFSTLAFRWSSTGGMEALGDLPGGSVFSAASDCSNDGKLVVGSSQSGNGGEAFRWRADTGMVGLGDLPGGYFLSNASAITPNGDFVVGGSSSANGTSGNRIEAFLWSEQTGMIGLGDLPGGDFESSADGISGDGSLVVGASVTEAGYQAFIWRSDTGMRNLADMLSTDFGLSLPGWRLFAARAISADGTTIVGEGVNPDGFIEGWIAHIPEPGTLPLLSIAGVVLIARRRCASGPAAACGVATT